MMRPGDKLASYHQLADAVGRLDAEDVVLLVAGDGPARGEVETAFRDVLRGRVRFLGELTKTDLAQTLTAADIYVWPAVGEAYGMALLEAQAAGLPVVAGRVRGVVDVVIDGQTGLLAAPDDPSALADQLKRVLGDRDLRLSLGTAAREFVRRERNIDSAAVILRRAVRLAVGPSR